MQDDFTLAGPPLDPRTGGVISPIVAAALCIKPRGLLTPRQAENVDVLKQALPIFACMRSLAMRFRGLLRGNDPDALDDWIGDAMGRGIHVIQKFAAKLRYETDAVRNAICEPWNNGQTEWRGLGWPAGRMRVIRHLFAPIFRIACLHSLRL